MAAIELYTPQGAEMVSGMMYEPYEHHLVGGYVRYISPYIIIIIIIIIKWASNCHSITRFKSLLKTLISLSLSLLLLLVIVSHCVHHKLESRLCSEDSEKNNSCFHFEQKHFQQNRFLRMIVTPTNFQIIIW